MTVRGAAAGVCLMVAAACSGSASSGAKSKSSATSAPTYGCADPTAVAGSQGAACTTNEECASRNCVSIRGDAHVCASVCSTASECPSAYRCLGDYCFPACAADSAQGGWQSPDAGAAIAILGKWHVDDGSTATISDDSIVFVSTIFTVNPDGTVTIGGSNLDLSVIEFDNDRRVAIVWDMFGGMFSQVYWTPVTAGQFYFCNDGTSFASAAQAVTSISSAHVDSGNLTKGCEGSAWLRFTAAQ